MNMLKEKSMEKKKLSTGGDKYVRKTDRKYLVKTGRPTTYKPEYCEDIIEFMSTGQSLTAWCAKHNIWRERAMDWMNADPNFRHAYNIAKVKAQVAEEAEYKELMLNNDFKHSGMKQKWMAVRFEDWREKVHTVNQNQNLNINADVDIDKVKSVCDEIELKEF